MIWHQISPLIEKLERLVVRGVYVFLGINFLAAAVMFYIWETWSIGIGIFLCVEGMIYYFMSLRKKYRERLQK